MLCAAMGPLVEAVWLPHSFGKAFWPVAPAADVARFGAHGRAAAICNHQTFFVHVPGGRATLHLR